MIQQALDAGGAVRINAGGGTIVLDATLEVTREGILDLGGATLSGGGARRVIEVSNPSNAFYTFVLQHGAVASGSTPGASGAGLYKATGGPWQAVTLHIFDVDFNDNHAIAVAQDDGGGAIYVVGAAELAIVGSTFSANSGANGGALYSLGSQRVNLYDSVFESNGATGNGGNPGSGGNGGAIGVDGDARYVNLCRVRLSGNIANAFGGGLFTVTYSAASFTRIADSTLEANISNAPDKLAGGAYIQGSPLEIRGSTFKDNSANGYAGLALFGYGGVLTGSIVNSTFVGNTARGGLGGAMSIAAATALTLQNVTIARNTAPCDVCFAAGIANDSRRCADLEQRDLRGQRRRQYLQPVGDAASGGAWRGEYCSGHSRAATARRNYRVAPGTTFAGANLADPADNGGPTETMALTPGSPATDAGTSSGAPATDQRGYPRVGAVDIGAFEQQGDAIFADGFDG